MPDTDNRYLHLIRQDCPLPHGTHVVVYCRDSGGDEQDHSVAREYSQHNNLVLNKLYVDNWNNK
jgi:5-methylcytosine-specific restriction endonuclease McrA